VTARGHQQVRHGELQILTWGGGISTNDRAKKRRKEAGGPKTCNGVPKRRGKKTLPGKRALTHLKEKFTKGDSKKKPPSREGFFKRNARGENEVRIVDSVLWARVTGSKKGVPRKWLRGQCRVV